MKRVTAFALTFLIFGLTRETILKSMLIPQISSLKKKPVERNLLSFISSEEKNQKYEVARFNRMLTNYMHTLNQKQNTAKQFLDIMDDEDREIEDKFIQAKRGVKRMKDDALNEIEATMTTLGLGLS